MIVIISLSSIITQLKPYYENELGSIVLFEKNSLPQVNQKKVKQIRNLF